MKNLIKFHFDFVKKNEVFADNLSRLVSCKSSFFDAFISSSTLYIIRFKHIYKMNFISFPKDEIAFNIINTLANLNDLISTFLVIKIVKVTFFIALSCS